MWAFEVAVRAKALALDPTRELAEELSLVCAVAVARASESELLGKCRPRSDRLRLETRTP